MAKAKSKAIPKKRGTKKASPSPKPKAPETPFVPNRGLKEHPGYREVEVQAVETGTYEYVERPKGERFRMGVVGPLPSWVKEV